MFALAALTHFEAQNNFIEDLPDDAASFKKLSKLNAIDLRYNALTTLPAAIGELKTLKKLFVSHNRLTSLPSR